MERLVRVDREVLVAMMEVTAEETPAAQVEDSEVTEVQVAGQEALVAQAVAQEVAQEARVVRAGRVLLTLNGRTGNLGHRCLLMEIWCRSWVS